MADESLPAMAPPGAEKVIPPPLKDDIVFAERSFQRVPCYVAKSKLAETYFRMSREEAKIAHWFDGKTSLGELLPRIASAFPHLELTLPELYRFYRQLSSSELLQESPEVFLQKREAVQKAMRDPLTLWRGGVMRLIFFRIPLVNPNGWVGIFAPIWRFLFSWPALVLFLALWTYAGTAMVTRIGQMQNPAVDFLSGFQIPLAVVALILAKSLHEIGHCATCKAYGGNVNELGVGFLLFLPIGYVDASDAWMMDSRWKRIAVTVAGVYTELWIAALAALVWVHTQPGVIHSFALSLLFVATVSTLLFNLNPLLRFDGYYLLSDLLDIPNLRTKAIKWFGGNLKKFFFGLPNPRPEDGSGLVFMIYAAAVFTWVTLVVVRIGARFVSMLDPVGLQNLGLGLGLFMLSSIVCVPLIKSYQETREHHKLAFAAGLPPMGSRRPFLRASVLGGLAAALLIGYLFFLPTRFKVRTQGVFEPSQSFVARAPADGTLAELAVQAGQRVEKGDLLYRFREEEHLLEMRRLAAARDREAVLFRHKVGLPGSDGQRGAAVHAETLRELANRTARLAGEREQLVVHSPLAGQVLPMGSQPLDLLPGAGVRRGETFLQVAAPSEGTVLAAVPEGQARVLRPGDRAVAIAEEGGGRREYVVTSVAARPARPAELQAGHLSSAGGSVPVPGTSVTPEALDQFPVVLVRLDPADKGEFPFDNPVVGSRVHLRIHGAPTTYWARMKRTYENFWESRTAS